MDSFYDVPRRAPVPTQVEKFLSIPVVPEVSMVCVPKNSVNNYTPYNTWKMNQHSTENGYILTSNRENIMNGPHNLNLKQFPSPHTSSQFLRKQVRFESPVLQQRPSLTYEPFIRKKVDVQNCVSSPHFINDQPQVCEKADLSSPQAVPQISGKTFEQIYMANVPNRQLDLSIIDLPNNPKIVERAQVQVKDKEQEINDSYNSEVCTNLKMDNCKNKENELPKTYRQFLNSQKKETEENKMNLNDSVVDIFNYKRNGGFHCNQTPQKIVGASKNCSTKNKLKTKDQKTDFSVKDATILNDVSRRQIQDSAQRTPTYKRPIHDTKIHRSNTPLRSRTNCNTSPSYKYLDHSSIRDRLQNYSPKCDSETQTSIDHITPENDEDKVFKEPLNTIQGNSEPTNKDLLKIIAQQNEQLLILQKQVAMLLNRDQQNQPKQIEAAPQFPQRANYMNEKCLTSTQNENFKNPLQDLSSTPRKKGLSKFSIDLMTSFEVSIRPQHNRQNFINYEPKIQEVTESESVATESASTSDKNVVDTSLHLQEPVKVRELCPSPEPSININMNDYDSSDDDEVSASEIGATFYHNLMGQVNNILKKAQIQTKEDFGAREGGKNGVFSNKTKDQTMSRVKEATLKHLRNIGVTIGPIDDSDNSASSGSDSRDYSPTEISFAVKQLLMKYLPNEQLAKITCNQARSVPVPKDASPGVIPVHPEFSFASVQYMRKYNLIQSNNEVKSRDPEQLSKVPYPQKVEGPKILDITALKMQPKLL